MGADVKANTGGGGALQLLDVRLLEDGGERGGALDSDLVAIETAVEERSEDVREQLVKGRGHKSEHCRVVAHLSSEIIVSLRTAAITEAPLSPILLAQRLQARGVGSQYVNGR